MRDQVINKEEDVVVKIEGDTKEEIEVVDMAQEVAEVIEMTFKERKMTKTITIQPATPCMDRTSKMTTMNIKAMINRETLHTKKKKLIRKRKVVRIQEAEVVVVVGIVGVQEEEVVMQIAEVVIMMQRIKVSRSIMFIEC